MDTLPGKKILIIAYIQMIHDSIRDLQYENCSTFHFVIELIINNADEVCTYIIIIIIYDKKLSNASAIMNDEIHILMLYCNNAESY